MRLIQLALILTTFLLFACSNQINQQISRYQNSVATQIEDLNQQLQNRSLSNAIMLRTYTTQLKTMQPGLSELLDNLVQSAEPHNKLISSYEERLRIVNQNPKSLGSKEDLLNELKALKNATDPAIYNDSLVDVVNTVAQLSNGKLPLIENNTRVTNDPNNGPASALVGNPNYGSWHNSGGQSFWVWYGQYRLFSDLLWHRPYYYHSWYYHRPWSFYQDYGSNLYSSKRQRKRQSKLLKSNSKQLKQYGKRTGRNISAYGSKRRNSSFKPSASSIKSKSLSNRIGATRKTSIFSASHRSGFRSTSRFGGK